MKFFIKDFFSKDSVTFFVQWNVGVMLTIIKVFIILFLLVGTGNIREILKINQ